MSRNYYKSGSYNAICEVCGSRFKSEDMLKRWDGKMVCRPDFEVRHSLDFIKSHQRTLSVPWTRPEAEDSFPFDVLLLQENGDNIIIEGGPNAKWFLTTAALPSL